MDETCIVCLGDLASSGGSPSSGESGVVTGLGHHDLSLSASRDPSNIKHEVTNNDNFYDTAVLDPSAAIAHLLPCGHNLHNECLKPWVERANSCPICRASFNMVELKTRINGPTLDSYAVQDKKQVADIDPSMLIDDDLFDEPAIEPCIFCEEYGEDELLLLCDGCNASCHTYCAGLNAVPAGPWFCQFCVEDQILQHGPPAASSPRQRRGRQGRQRSDASGEAWARVWQSVWDNLNLDLDFPFDDDLVSPHRVDLQRTDTQRRDFAQWQRRFHIAERLGGAARFRDTATTLLDRAPPPPESQDELRAWNAFDKAKELQANDANATASPGSRKRKSTPASPAESAPEPERKLKRPRTRRAQDIADASSDAGGESSTSGRRMTDSPSIATGNSHRQDAGLPVPSFFQSLLKEVETKPSESNLNDKRLTLDVSTPTDFPPVSISPGSSPTTSRQPSPHLRPSSPPPNYLSRPSSPPPLTSRIEPVYAMPSQNHSPSARIVNSSDSDDSATDIISSTRHAPRRKDKSPQLHPTSTSPLQPSISPETKNAIREMVKAALRPIYKSRKINTQEYTDINMTVSRMLYERVGEVGGGVLDDEEERERWRVVAAEEVGAAVKRLGKHDDVDVPIRESPDEPEQVAGQSDRVKAAA